MGYWGLSISAHFDDLGFNCYSMVLWIDLVVRMYMNAMQWFGTFCCWLGWFKWSGIFTYSHMFAWLILVCIFKLELFSFSCCIILYGSLKLFQIDLSSILSCCRDLPGVWFHFLSKRSPLGHSSCAMHHLASEFHVLYVSYINLPLF